ncbi:MAG TPA: aminoglycoside phosphotransferase family protein [Paraburkholderia sp.]|jgi:aminoglycoside phosphotransferase|nr:aminoglycoside phosphotransferase family protein [Paraburkholderia sp.]
MLNESPELLRLADTLAAAGIGSRAQIRCGTAGVASPTRLATEWAGFFVEEGARTWYAKVRYDDTAELVDVERSAQASRCAAEAGASVALRFADAARGVLLFDALPEGRWRWARVDELSGPAQLERLWELKRRVHAGPVPGFERTLADDLARVRALCRHDAVTLPADHAWLDTCVDLACDALQRARSEADGVPLHGDGVASNVMIGPDGALLLVDFDYGGVGDPWHDVAVTLNELYQFEAQWRDGIARWAGRCDEADYARCRLYALADDWYWTLWGLWLGATSPRRLEFTKLAQWTLLRCRQSIHDARFEGWLRQLGEHTGGQPR